MASSASPLPSSSSPSSVAPPVGLSLQTDVITSEFELETIQWLDAREWKHVNPSNPGSRRIQQYGYGYGYMSRTLSPEAPMAGPILQIAELLERAGLMVPVQCIVNEYYQTQGIAAHIDNKNFGPRIIGMSIGADGVITFKRGSKQGVERYDCFLPRRSVMMMVDEARYAWTHEISGNKSYTVDGVRIPKPTDYRRISLTFRELAITPP